MTTVSKGITEWNFKLPTNETNTHITQIINMRWRVPRNHSQQFLLNLSDIQTWWCFTYVTGVFIIAWVYFEWFFWYILNFDKVMRACGFEKGVYLFCKLIKRIFNFFNFPLQLEHLLVVKSFILWFLFVDQLQ